MPILRRLSSYSSRALLRAEGSVCWSCSRRLYSKDIIKENDVVLLQSRRNPNADRIITSPLQAGGEIKLERDSIKMDHIIGRGFRETVETKRRRYGYRITRPTLGEYTDSSPRIVTPIYSQDASLIVSLLDLHPDVPGAKDTSQDRLEIFEAGTGHGALTLHLARAIHGANTAAPSIPDYPDRFETIDEKKVYQAWQKERKAVIQTLDCNISHSRRAQKVVRNFRHGIYYPHVDFHVGSIVTYLTSRLATSDQKPFLDHAILDLPNTQEYLEIVKKALKPNGTLITFCPSITQINASVMLVKEKSMPLFLEKVVEVGAGIGVGGREWDVRPVKPRALIKSEAEALAKAQAAEEIVEDAEGESQDPEGDQDGNSTEEVDEISNFQPANPQETGLEMVCRPKVGGRISGGGFLGVWRRMINHAGDQSRI